MHCCFVLKFGFINVVKEIWKCHTSNIRDKKRRLLSTCSNSYCSPNFHGATSNFFFDYSIFVHIPLFTLMFKACIVYLSALIFKLLLTIDYVFILQTYFIKNGADFGVHSAENSGIVHSCVFGNSGGFLSFSFEELTAYSRKTSLASI